MNSYKVKDLGNGVILIVDDVVHMFLVLGKKQALLIDTGFGRGNLRAQVENLWTGPLFVLNTHSHIDHVGADGQFVNIMAHPGDWKQICENTGLAEDNLQPIGEGTRIDLGGRELHIYETPGHTPGSVVILDPVSRLLFGGDNVSDKPIFLCLEGASVKEYLQSLYRLQKLACQFDVLYASHGTVFQEKSQIQELIDCCQAYLDGNLRGIPSEPYAGIPRILYRLGRASFFVAANC